ncbi:endoribonuclease MazF [Desulfonema magnum]|uniref:Endoribonuclease toxin, mazF-like n=1 Tax=Desulfonema magnum TaxID=45655 RepID=A0A975BX77_9BACT|nr:endoribonuclease MazF [Desulfonema magnum]QTA92845.1 Putative endoribonuclease toxin, mazF-like [Desulfonema magnum]
MNYVPDRGDVVWINMNPRAGHEQGGKRPALVLSPKAYNGKVRLALFCPITTRVKGYPFEVVIPEGCGVSGVILSDQIKSLDWRARNADLACKLPDEVTTDVMKKLGTLLIGLT